MATPTRTPQPLCPLSTISPPQRPRTLSHTPRNTGQWSRFLEADATTTSSPIQRQYPGIRPNPSGRRENELYSVILETFTIRLNSYSHIVTTLHDPVVLPQSAWLRGEVTRLRTLRQRARQQLSRQGQGQDQADDDVTIHIPSHLGWWEVAWCLEYMYTGAVPGFSILTCRDGLRPRRTEDTPRLTTSVIWGLVQLWIAASFFGLAELKARAEQAFVCYLGDGMRHTAATRRWWREHHNMRTRYSFEMARWEVEFSFEVEIATEVLFSEGHSNSAPYWGLPYLCLVGSENRDRRVGRLTWDAANSVAEVGRQPEVRAWGQSIYGFRYGPWPAQFSTGLTPGDYHQARMRLGPMMLDLCMRFARRGLFEVVWLQNVIVQAPSGMMTDLEYRIRLPEHLWLRDRFPNAPFAFPEGRVIESLDMVPA